MSDSIINIYTDGSCHHADGLGGWGFIIYTSDSSIKMYGSKRNTTSNRMEMMAVIKALMAIDTNKIIVIHSDSQYVVNGIKSNGWQNKLNKANADLWRVMMKQVNRHVNVVPQWVKGHSGIEGNEIADKLAGKGRAKLTKDIKFTYHCKKCAQVISDYQLTKMQSQQTGIDCSHCGHRVSHVRNLIKRGE